MHVIFLHLRLWVSKHLLYSKLSSESKGADSPPYRKIDPSGITQELIPLLTPFFSTFCLLSRGSSLTIHTSKSPRSSMLFSCVFSISSSPRNTASSTLQFNLTIIESVFNLRNPDAGPLLSVLDPTMTPLPSSPSFNWQRGGTAEADPKAGCHQGRRLFGT